MKLSRSFFWKPLGLGLSLTLGLSLFNLAATFSPAYAADSVISDPGLAACINQQIGNRADTAPLTKSDLAGITKLNCRGKQVASVAGLENATRLTYLDVSSNPLQDITPLRGLPRLNYLCVSTTQVSDVTPVSESTTLKHLILDRSPIRDLSVVKQLKQLESLTLYNVPVADYSFLPELPALRMLHVSAITPETFQLFASLNNLRQVAVFDAPISDLSPLSAATKIEKLQLVNTAVQDLHPLANLSSLRYLSLHKTKIADLSGIENLSALNDLSLETTQVKDLSPVASLRNLDRLVLNTTPITDITPLAQLPQLKKLYMHKVKAKDFTPLAALTQLNELGVFQTNMTDLSPLSQLTQLTYLDVRYNQISDFQVLNSHPNLSKYKLYPQIILLPIAVPEYTPGLKLEFSLDNLDYSLIAPNGEKISTSVEQGYNMLEANKLVAKTDTGYQLTFNSEKDHQRVLRTYYLFADGKYFAPALLGKLKTPEPEKQPEGEENTETETGESNANPGSIPGSENKPGNGSETGPGSGSNSGTDSSTDSGTGTGSGTSNPDSPVPGQPDSDQAKPDAGKPKPDAGTPNPGQSDSSKLSFIDTATYPFVKEIEWLAISGVTTGYPDKTFRPHDSVSRAAMAAFLYRLEGKPAYTAPKQSPFTDIKPGDDFYKEICWLASKGITKGYADGSFKPWDSISREAMAAFLHRYDNMSKDKVSIKGKELSFTDTGKSLFKKDIAWLSSTGITTGYKDGTFRPYDPIERGAIAAFFYRMKH